MTVKRKVAEAPPMTDEERDRHMSGAVSHCMGLLEASRLIAEWKKVPKRIRKIKEFDIALREQAFMWVGLLAIEKPFLETLVRMNHRNTPEWQQLKKALPPNLKKLLKVTCGATCGGAKLKKVSVLKTSTA